MTAPGGAMPMAVWAARDLLRRPGSTLLLAAALWAVTLFAAAPLLFYQALDTTLDRLMAAAPDLVVRRLGPDGWAPMPAVQATALAGSVPGALDPTPRLWGVAAGPDGPVTVAALDGTQPVPHPAVKGLTAPSPGKAVVGPGVAGLLTGGRLTVTAARELTVAVTGRFGPETGLVTRDLVWLAPQDFRRLMNLAPGQASDLAVRVHHNGEARAVGADLTTAFPWPVAVFDRTAAQLRQHGRMQQAAAGGAARCLPALLALALLMVSTVGNARARSAHWGLLKALGWTPSDIVRLQVIRALIVAAPSMALGAAAACAAVFLEPVAGIAGFWLVQSPPLPGLYLDGTGAALVTIEIAALVGLPYLVAVLVSTLRVAAGDPWAMLQADAGY